MELKTVVSYLLLLFACTQEIAICTPIEEKASDLPESRSSYSILEKAVTDPTADCSCGRRGRCEFVEGVKKCECDEGYVDHDGMCLGHPKFSSSYETVTFEEHQSASLYCNATGENITYTWYNPNDVKYISNPQDPEFRLTENENGSIFSFISIFKNHTGSYTCTAENARGLDSKVIAVSVNVSECDCGSQGSCYYRNGIKMCHCQEGYVFKDGTCNTDPCREPHANKICAYKTGTECYFNETSGQIDCICRDLNTVYDERERRCKGSCSSDFQCNHGGVCLNDFCRCLPGLSGDFCKHIDDCSDDGVWSRCKRFGVCSYSEVERRAVCRCNDGYELDERERVCKYVQEHCHIDFGCVNGFCTNTIYGPECRCEPGFYGKYCDQGSDLQVRVVSNLFAIIIIVIAILVVLFGILSVVFCVKTRKLLKKQNT